MGPSLLEVEEEDLESWLSLLSSSNSKSKFDLKVLESEGGLKFHIHLPSTHAHMPFVAGKQSALLLS